MCGYPVYPYPVNDNNYGYIWAILIVIFILFFLFWGFSPNRGNN